MRMLCTESSKQQYFNFISAQWNLQVAVTYLQYRQVQISTYAHIGTDLRDVAQS